MAPNNPDHYTWHDCPAETLADLVHRKRRASRRKMMAAIVSAGVTGIAAIVVGVSVLQATRPRKNLTVNVPPSKHTVCCNTVLAAMDRYHAGKIDRCLRLKIDMHLARCKICANVYRLSLNEEA